MQDKPFDRFTDKPPRRDFSGRDRFSSRDRFSDRERFSDRDRFSDRGDRFEGRFQERSDRGFGRRDDRGGFHKAPRRDFGTRSGPRARAVDRRRFTDHADFVKTATVRLDADVAPYFKTAADVNEALRHVIALSELAKKAQSEADKPAEVLASDETSLDEVKETAVESEEAEKETPSAEEE